MYVLLLSGCSSPEIKSFSIKTTMKIFCSILVLIGVLCSSCASDDEQAVQPGKVQFSLSLNSGSSGGRVSETIPPESVVLLSLTKSSGEIVFVQTQIEILSFGASYITAPTELPPGDYIVTEFLIENNGSVIYAAPKEGSKFATEIDDPLPRAITVSSNGVSNFEMEVISTRHQQPQAFGYVSFQPDLINPIPLMIFAESDGGLAVSGATVRIYNYHAEYEFREVNHMATIPFRGNVDEVYTLEVKRLGYHTFRRTFTYEDLLTEMDGHALVITLLVQHEISVEMYPIPGKSYRMVMQIRDEGVLYVDWGDNSPPDTLRFPEDTNEGGNAAVWHAYDPPFNKFGISITGDIDLISAMSMPSDGEWNGPQSSILMMDMKNAIALERLSISGAYMTELEISEMQSSLRNLDLSNVTISNLKLPERHNIRYFEIIVSRIPYNTLFESLYHNAVEYGLLGIVTINILDRKSVV